MKYKLIILLALLSFIFYVMKLLDLLPLNEAQTAFITILTTWSLHLSLKFFIGNHTYHVLIIFVIAGFLTLDRIYSGVAGSTIYILLVATIHGFVFIMALISIPMAHPVVVAHAQQITPEHDDND